MAAVMMTHSPRHHFLLDREEREGEHKRPLLLRAKTLTQILVTRVFLT